MMASHPGFLSPTSFLSPKGAVRKNHNGYIYCQDMRGANGVRYFRCINKSAGCKGRLKSSPAGSVVTKAHTCLPAHSTAVNQRPEVVRPQIQQQHAKRPQVHRKLAQRHQAPRKQAQRPDLPRPPAPRRPQQVQRQGARRPVLLSPNSFLASTGGERKRYAGYLYKLQFARPSGYKYYSCVDKKSKGCPGSMSSSARGPRVVKAHTCRLTPGQGTAGHQTPVLLLTPIDRRMGFQPIRSPLGPETPQRSDENDWSDAEEEETTDPLRQLQTEYLRQKMEIGALTKEKLQLETLVLQRAVRGRAGGAGGAVAPPNPAPTHTQRVSFASPPSAGVQQRTTTTCTSATTTTTPTTTTAGAASFL